MQTGGEAVAAAVAQGQLEARGRPGAEIVVGPTDEVAQGLQVTTQPGKARPEGRHSGKRARQRVRHSPASQSTSGRICAGSSSAGAWPQPGTSITSALGPDRKSTRLNSSH